MSAKVTVQDTARAVLAGGRPCANPDCRTVIDPERVRRRPNIKTCSAPCRQAVWKLRSGYVKPAARDGGETAQTPRKRKGGGPRGVSLPYRRTVDALVDFLVSIGYRDELPDVAAERVLRSALSEANRARLSRLEREYPEASESLAGVASKGEQ